MADKNSAFFLSDGDILLHLQNSTQMRHEVLFDCDYLFFGDLQHTKLIQALMDRRYTTADSLLRKLTAPLPPRDAMAVCLCALDSTEERMGRILDHCPPLPDFQFLGVGKTESLLNVAIQFNLYKMLELFLKRGADPNANPTARSDPSPLEQAFCDDAVLPLERLLRSPKLRLELTPAMLKHWGALAPDLDDPYPKDLMCCQLLVETLTGVPSDPKDPFPFPPQLTLETILEQKNLPFAAHLCRKRPLAEHEQEAAIRYLSSDRRIILLDERAMDPHLEQHRHHADFLLCFLERYPERIRLPALRFPIAATALVPNKPEQALQALVAQLEDGPVFLKELSAPGGTYTNGRPYPKLNSHFTLSRYLFPRWDERLGKRLVPSMELSADLYLPYMDEEEMQLVLDRIVFTGQPPEDRISPVAEQFLLYAPESLLPGLLAPGGLLTRESPHPLLDACLALPVARRNQLLPHLHQTVDYEL